MGRHDHPPDPAQVRKWAGAGVGQGVSGVWELGHGVGGVGSGSGNGWVRESAMEWAGVGVAWEWMTFSECEKTSKLA